MAFHDNGNQNKRKRLIQDEHRHFKESWTYSYFIIENNQKLLCLICNETVSFMKEYNVKRHYQQHAPKYDIFQGQCRIAKVDSLRKALTSQQQQFYKPSHENQKLTKVSYVVSDIIAKRLKPHTDGEFVKECFQAFTDIVCPEKKATVSKLCLSARTISRRIDDIAGCITFTLRERATNFKYFSVAVDESTDMTDTAQLAVFIRGVDKDLNITEELASLVGLKGSTTGDDIFEGVKNVLDKFNLKFDHCLSGIATDGAPAIIGRHQGLIAFVLKEVQTLLSPVDIVIYHCIIHQESLCAKSLGLNNVMKVVVSTVNFIQSRGLNHRQFQELLIELDSEYGDVIYFSQVRWLSKAATLKRVWKLKEEISNFMEMKGTKVEQFLIQIF